MASTNWLEQLNKALKRRSRVIEMFPSKAVNVREADILRLTQNLQPSEKIERSPAKQR